MRRHFLFCIFLMGGVAPACAFPVAPVVSTKQFWIENIAGRAAVLLRAPKMRATMRSNAVRPVRVAKVSVVIVRKERRPRKQPYAIPDIPKQK